MIYILISLLAGFIIGYIGMSWYLGHFRDRFNSNRAYHVNMFFLLAVATYFGTWARMMLQS